MLVGTTGAGTVAGAMDGITGAWATDGVGTAAGDSVGITGVGTADGAGMASMEVVFTAPHFMEEDFTEIHTYSTIITDPIIPVLEQMLRVITEDVL